MALLVLKYGGSSLATPKHINAAADHIRRVKNEGNQLVVVVSAMGRTTDHLVRLAKKTVSSPPRRELDMLLTSGERVSMSLLAMALLDRKVDAISFTGSQVGIVTDGTHNDARIVDIRAHRLQEELSRGKVVIVAGFQGVSHQKEITTLGRGGSDTTAVALAAALNADRCDILTDVAGLYTADPKLVPDAKLMETCSYDHALNMAALGAKLHARCVELAKKFEVKVRIASSRSPESKGTLLTPNVPNTNNRQQDSLGLAHKRGVCYFDVSTSLTRFLKLVDGKHLNLQFVNGVSERVTFVCPKEESLQINGLLQSEGIKFFEKKDLSLLSLVNSHLPQSNDTLVQLARTLESLQINVIAIFTSSDSISIALEKKDVKTAAQTIHRNCKHRSPHTQHLVGELPT